MPEVRKQRSLQAHFIALCIPHPAQKQPSLQGGLSEGALARRGGHAPSKRPSAQGLCLLLEISVLKTDSWSHVAGINCTSPVLQSGAKMHLCNLKLVLLSKMFHQINCKRKQSVRSYARLSTLSCVRPACVDNDEGISYSFKNGVPFLGHSEETNWILKEMAIAIYFQCINFCHFSTVYEKQSAHCSYIADHMNDL